MELLSIMEVFLMNKTTNDYMTSTDPVISEIIDKANELTDYLEGWFSTPGKLVTKIERSPYSRVKELRESITELKSELNSLLSLL